MRFIAQHVGFACIICANWLSRRDLIVRQSHSFAQHLFGAIHHYREGHILQDAEQASSNARCYISTVSTNTTTASSLSPAQHHNDDKDTIMVNERLKQFGGVTHFSRPLRPGFARPASHRALPRTAATPRRHLVAASSCRRLLTPSQEPCSHRINLLRRVRAKRS